ncbi:hypothetical protein [Novispirillum itersonii]|uniref:Uncharacterized protein n=1 Tax=Novispirillum itersonii TaxID=189 RepID=A0A7W9ZIV0_NOVIT|nr:hypothetical protein [Novispirillum itersonii]MBB6212301.1 hypothetical protein [Novispirillum itersonii]
MAAWVTPRFWRSRRTLGPANIFLSAISLADLQNSQKHCWSSQCIDIATFFIVLAIAVRRRNVKIVYAIATVKGSMSWMISR